MTARTILLIDDDDLFRKAVRLSLERAGHTVIEAGEGNEGLKCYKSNRCDVVVTDVIMPGKEGLETIRELKSLDPAVKIIAVSGGGRLDSRDYLPMAKAFGAARILDKPFSEQALLEAIEALANGAP